MRSASKAIIVSKNKYLLQLRDNKKNIYSPNCWGFFGGSCKKNETIEKCMRRELCEELSVNSNFMMKWYECLNDKTGTYLYFFYVNLKNKIALKKPNEGQALAWFSKNQIKKLKKKAWDLKIFYDFLI